MTTATTKGVPTQHANGTAPMTDSIEINIKEVQVAAAKASDTLVAWLRQLPLASFGLAAMISDETKVVANKLFMSKLVERGELVQKDAEQWMKDVQARFR